MQRREFTFAGIAGVTAAGLATLSLPARAQSASDYPAGKDYMVLRKPVDATQVHAVLSAWLPPTQSPSGVEQPLSKGQT